MMETKTIGELINLAVKEMPRWQRTFAKFSLNRRGRMQRISLSLSHNAEFLMLIKNPDVFAQDDFSATSSVIQFDPDNLRAILELILEFLPLFIDLFAGISRAAAVLLVCFCFASTTTANNWLGGTPTVCTGPECRAKTPATPVRNVVKAIASVPAKVIASVPVLQNLPAEVVYTETIDFPATQPALTRTYTTEVKTFRHQPVRRFGQRARGFLRRCFGCR